MSSINDIFILCESDKFEAFKQVYELLKSGNMEVLIKYNELMTDPEICDKCNDYVLSKNTNSTNPIILYENAIKYENQDIFKDGNKNY